MFLLPGAFLNRNHCGHVFGGAPRALCHRAHHRCVTGTECSFSGRSPEGTNNTPHLTQQTPCRRVPSGATVASQFSGPFLNGQNLK